MKIILTLISISFLYFNLKAQDFSKDSLVHEADSVHQAYRLSNDSIYGGLDKSYIPSGKLYDYCFPFIQLKRMI